MTDETRRDDGLDEERLADQAADLADRIARGESRDLGLLDAMNPAGSGALDRLLPAIRLLSELAGEEPTGEYPERRHGRNGDIPKTKFRPKAGIEFGS